MYNVSNEYKTEIAKRSVTSTWYGTITLTDSTVLSIGKDNIDQNKSKLTRQYVNGETLEIGNAFSNELVLGLRDTDSLQVSAHHYEFYGAVIELTFRLYGSSLSGGYEDVPCGIFTVEKAEFTYHTALLTAYDNLNKAAKTKLTSVLANSAPYTALSALCARSGITLGTSQADIEAMPNGTTSFAMSAFTKGTAIKDIIEAICACLCANAVCNRAGELEIKSYSTTSVKTIGDNLRYSSNYVDYIGRYTKIALENADGDEEVYNATVQYGEGKLLTLSIGKNTLINKKSTAARATIATNIINALAPILYAPLNISIPQDPAVDIGDSMTGSGSNFENPFMFIDTKDETALFGQTKITSAGGNYELANNKKSTKIEKAIDDLDNQVVEVGNNMAIVQTEVNQIAGKVNVGYILPTAVDTSDINDGTSHNVLTFDFAIEDVDTGDDDGQTVSFHAELCFYVDTTATANTSYGDGNVTVTYSMDGTTTSSSVHTYGDGWKILTLNGFFPNLTVGDHEFIVSVAANGGAIKDPT